MSPAAALPDRRIVQLVQTALDLEKERGVRPSDVSRRPTISMDPRAIANHQRLTWTDRHE